MSKKKEKPIAVSVIKRLPVYYRFLTTLHSKGVERISSSELAEKLGVTASQIRQDLSQFGNFGQRGYGYRVANLKEAIAKILGLDNQMEMVLAGAGNLGKAIINYPNFKRRGFYIKGIFDVNPELIGQEVAGLLVQDISLLADFLTKNRIDIGIITTPPESAVDVANIFVRGGIRGIWNFAPVSLNYSGKVLVENVHISESLLTLSYMIDEKFGSKS
ncbi:MAG: redox-sensing transcriptional repressor Rex [Firmicutes bacterium]|nr:redox-sensing transcriptional repressor Rex [Bacillota bacterium]